MDPASFLIAFPEFSNTALFPTSAISFWLSIAALRLDPVRWGTLLTIGTQLFVAHNLALEAYALKAGQFGGIPGLNSGPLAGKTVDKVSLTYAASEGSLTDAGDYNLTTFGTRFLRLSQEMGSGGMQF